MNIELAEGQLDKIIRDEMTSAIDDVSMLKELIADDWEELIEAFKKVRSFYSVGE